MPPSLLLSLLLGWFGDASPIPPPEGALLTLRKGPSQRGPSYRLTIFRDGSVEYLGEAGAWQRGPREDTISPYAVVQLAEAFMRAHFEDLPDEPMHVIDAQATSICLAGSPVHCLTYEPSQSPAAQTLLELTRQIERVARVSRWTERDPVEEPSEPMTLDRVEQAVRARLGDLEACYEPLLSRNPPVLGNERGGLAIDWDGAVKSQITETTLYEWAGEHCLLAILDGFRFSPPALREAWVSFAVEVKKTGVRFELDRCNGCGLPPKPRPEDYPAGVP